MKISMTSHHSAFLLGTKICQDAYLVLLTAHKNIKILRASARVAWQIIIGAVISREQYAVSLLPQSPDG